MKRDIIETIYEISEEYDVIMKNHIVINKDLNVKGKTIQLLKYKVVEYIHEIGVIKTSNTNH